MQIPMATDGVCWGTFTRAISNVIVINDYALNYLKIHSTIENAVVDALLEWQRWEAQVLERWRHTDLK